MVSVAAGSVEMHEWVVRGATRGLARTRNG